MLIIEINVSVSCYVNVRNELNREERVFMTIKYKYSRIELIRCKVAFGHMKQSDFIIQ